VWLVPGPPDRVAFYFDPICPWAYQTSLWIREIRERTGVAVEWRFFSLEEINRPDGKRHPWERPIAYGWTPMRVGAWLRRLDPELHDQWYQVCGRALHEDGRRPYEPAVAAELLASIGAPDGTWEAALADPTTHDDVRADHEGAVATWGGFGVPMIVFPWGRAVFGPCVAPAPTGDEAVALWGLTVAWARMPYAFELKQPKTPDHLRAIGELFAPYLTSRQWQTIQRPAP
jgi:2-hydroxychromene-2-carboxylate isomerase